MKWSYAFFHWLLTLLLAPLTSQLLHYLFIKNSHQIVALVEVYPITLIFSFIFSLPTLCFYILIFNYLQKINISINQKKLILVVYTMTGITLTMLFLKGSMTFVIIAAYTTTAFVVGIILPLKPKPRSVN
jgi:hypothetical protein